MTLRDLRKPSTPAKTPAKSAGNPQPPHAALEAFVRKSLGARGFGLSAWTDGGIVGLIVTARKHQPPEELNTNAAAYTKLSSQLKEQFPEAEIEGSPNQALATLTISVSEADVKKVFGLR